MRRPLLLGAACVALCAGGCGSSSSKQPAATTSSPVTTTTTAAPTIHRAGAPHKAAPTTSQPTPASTSSGSGSLPAGGSRPTPQQVEEAKRALAECQKENPGTTLAQLEKEAASPNGIQC